MIDIGEDKKTILLTRGDKTDKYRKLAFQYPIYNLATGQEELYEFQPEDKISFVVFNKKGYTKTEVLRVEKTLLEMGYLEPTTTPEIQLTEEDTKSFDLLNKSKTYWYDLVLNDSTTLLGYDDEGPKTIIVYPEAEEE